MKKQIEAEMAEMLEIIENSREEWSNDVTDHTENEYIREGLLNAGYRKSDILKEKQLLNSLYGRASLADPEKPKRYTVGEVVCDWGIFEDGELKLIVNSVSVAILVQKILEEDYLRGKFFNDSLLKP